MFDDGQCVFLVQDLLRGEELLDRALTVPNFTERDASDIICTLTKTVEYLHSQGVRQGDRARFTLTYKILFGFQDLSNLFFCLDNFFTAVDLVAVKDFLFCKTNVHLLHFSLFVCVCVCFRLCIET